MKRGDILMGVGAGLVSAVLFATVIRSSLAGILMFYLTPLPVAIVSLGWNHRAGLVAGGVGAVAVGVLFDAIFGFFFAAAFALPVWWLAFLSLLARESSADAITNGAKPARQWYPLGDLAIWVAGLSVLVTLGGALLLSFDYETSRSAIQEMVQTALKLGLGEGVDVLPGLGGRALTIERFASFMATFIVPSSAALWSLLTVLIMLVAAKLVSLSGRLPRPLPHVAREFVLPRTVLGGLIGSVALVPFPGWPRFIAIALAASIVFLFAMQGLATAHVLLARAALRPLILGIGYATIVVAEPWMLVGLALLGLADMALSLRARSLAHSSPRNLH